jgi:hypothetical protein
VKRLGGGRFDTKIDFFKLRGKEPHCPPYQDPTQVPVGTLGVYLLGLFHPLLELVGLSEVHQPEKRLRLAGWK